HGSARLGQSMLAAGLVDEIRLVIAPVVVGSGRRLFPAGATPAGLQLIRHEKTPGGLAIHEYKTVGAPVTGIYEPV
ncbi:MAG: deaminase, partial [Gordonia sp. (in: high G+C Gram-positive bacteria)]